MFSSKFVLTFALVFVLGNIYTSNVALAEEANFKDKVVLEMEKNMPKFKDVKENEFDKYRKEAEKGDAISQVKLGICYLNGIGVTKDQAIAVEWFKKAATQKSIEAQYYLGLCYKDGLGVVEDKIIALKFLYDAVDLCRDAIIAGDPEAMVIKGMCYEMMEYVGDPRNPIECYMEAADKGYAPAMLKIGLCYYKRELRVIEESKSYCNANAVRWFRKAAEAGNAEAQFLLGLCYENGKGVAKDKDYVNKWYRKAADQGYLPAKEALEKLEK